MNWYEQLPPLCPPSDAVPCGGTFYRIAKGNPATDGNFFSHYNKLTIDRILDFCDVPQLFIARDVFDTIYLCLLYDDEPLCQYTAIRISNNRLQEFLGGEKDLRELFDNPETAFEYFDVEYRDDDYYFEPHQAASVGEERLPLSGYKMSGDEHEAVVVRIPVKDRSLLKDIVRKFGWACVF